MQEVRHPLDLGRAVLLMGLLFVMILLFTGCSLPQSRIVSGAEGESYTVVDAEGTKVTIPHKPKRIVAGNLTYDHMLLGLTPAENLVVVSKLDLDPLSSFVPEETKSVKFKNPSLLGISLELVVDAKPDLIVVPGWTSRNEIEMYRGLGYPVVVGKGPRTIEDVYTNISILSAALGVPERGEIVNREMKRQMDEIEEVLSRQGKPEPSALIVSRMDSWGGPGSIYDEILHRAHVRNGIAEAGLKNGETLTKELVLKSDPDMFFISIAKPGKGLSKFQKKWFDDPSMAHMKALKHIEPIESRYLYCASQNIPYAVKAIANAAYGPIFDMSDEHLIRGY